MWETHTEKTAIQNVPDVKLNCAPIAGIATDSTMPPDALKSAVGARGCQRLSERSTTIWGPLEAISAPSVKLRGQKAGNSSSTTATPPGKCATYSATTATPHSGSSTTIPIPSPRQPSTSESTLPERSQQIVAWRNEGVSYKEIGRRLGLTRQRVTQLWEQAQTAKPTTCWCGTLIPLNIEQGRPKTYCKPEHAPSYVERVPRPPKKLKPPKSPKECWCGVTLTGHGLRKYCSPEHAPYRAHSGFKGTLTRGQYDQMRSAQNDTCAICKQPEAVLRPSGSVKNLAVDHCHDTGKIRELLCSNCNMMLGLLGDDPERMERAAEYLREHAA